MKSIAQPSFWERYQKLPAPAQRAAREAYRTFSRDPGHPGLRFKLLQGHDDLWSVRLNDSYRAVGIRDGATIYWFWIGSHAQFNRYFG